MHYQHRGVASRPRNNDHTRWADDTAPPQHWIGVAMIVIVLLAVLL